jgi:antitoxin FitA
MNGAQAVDMSYTPSNVVHMPKMIQVRNVPDELHLRLKARALQEGMTLSDFIKRELEKVATKRMTFEEIDARIAARRRPGAPRPSTQAIIDAIREVRGD